MLFLSDFWRKYPINNILFRLISKSVNGYVVFLPSFSMEIIETIAVKENFLIPRILFKKVVLLNDLDYRISF